MPVVPVAIQGSWQLNQMWPFTPGAQVEIAIGAPMERTAGDAAEKLKRARDWIAAHLEPAPPPSQTADAFLRPKRGAKRPALTLRTRLGTPPQDPPAVTLPVGTSHTEDSLA